MKFRRRLPVMRFAVIIALLFGCMPGTLTYAENGRSLRNDAGSLGSGQEEGGSGFGDKALRDAEEERSYRRDNVVITVKKLYAEDRYHWNFEITVENLNDIKKTVEGRICLYNMYIQPRECGSEECGVNMAVQPKSVQVQKFRCRGKMDMNSWTFLIVTIHNY
ncbi:MAG TPA: hypothetical protein PKN50_15725 [Spirochaetota bacterium]|nr:hypothetical protein [Spirochaetota bacterium]HPV40586.1 hypothetical protein [Spirochaetota bacterium]